MKRTLEFLRNTLEKNTTVVLGLSGGPDSMCLFYVLLSLKEEYNLNIVCAHINHNVRKESKEEELFVKEQVEQNHCRFETRTLSLNQDKNFEANARKERYRFFEELAKKYKAKYVMTAHHGDDLMETILMRMTRGSNLNGYIGFKKKTECGDYSLVRPLIYTTKEEILSYCKEQNIPYCIDKSNESDEHTRNRYRKKVLPFLKEENKEVHLKFLKFSEELEMASNYLQKKTLDALTQTRSFGKVNLHEFNKLEPLIKKRVIEYILKEEYQNDIDLIQDIHTQSILKLCTSTDSFKELHLPLRKTIVKEYDTLFFAHKKEEKREEYILEEKVVLKKNEWIEKVEKTSVDKSNFLIRLNSKELSLPLKVRPIKEEDVMEVKNLGGHKKVKEILRDAKIPKSKRENLFVVVDHQENVLWLPGLKKSKFDKNKDEFYDIIYKYVIMKEEENEK